MIRNLKDAIWEKDAPHKVASFLLVENILFAFQKYLQVASTRLTNRHQRPNIELCRDEPAHRLIEEVTELETTVQQLENKVGAARAGDGTSRSFTVFGEGLYLGLLLVEKAY